MRKTQTYHIKNLEEFKLKLLHWCMHSREIAWMDSNNYEQKYSNFDAILAIDAFTSIQTDFTDAFNKLKEFKLIHYE